ncbi:MAG: hypothetical protein KDA20_08060 [Phycisphaerales bacterium]|nr:hypothetical protein [Phycisphaerales bacterium]
MRRYARNVSLIGALLASATVTGAAGTSSTTFTYQGRLRDAGLPANGTYHVDYWLWDAESGGNQVGSTIHFVTHEVANGVLSSQLDFGPGAFDGSPRWLEIHVDGATLSPRQPITATPYAIAGAAAARQRDLAPSDELAQAVQALRAENQVLRERLARLEARLDEALTSGAK